MKFRWWKCPECSAYSSPVYRCWMQGLFLGGSRVAQTTWARPREWGHFYGWACCQGNADRDNSDRICVMDTLHWQETMWDPVIHLKLFWTACVHFQVYAARQAIGDSDFFLVARTDARGTSAKRGLEESITRANLYMARIWLPAEIQWLLHFFYNALYSIVGRRCRNLPCEPCVLCRMQVQMRLLWEHLGMYMNSCRLVNKQRYCASLQFFGYSLQVWPVSRSLLRYPSSLSLAFLNCFRG